MPEGHHLHRLAAALDDAFGGDVVAVSSPQGRFADGAAVLDGRPIVRAFAGGKHLFVEFAGPELTGPAYLHIHLGLIGELTIAALALGAGGEVTVPPPVGAVRVRLLSDRYVADLRGATLCEVAAPEDVAQVLRRLGPDPLVADADPDAAWARISRSTRPIAELLMDQSVIAGVGNVYRSEVLFRLRVDPYRPGREIRRRSFAAIWADLRLLMPIGVRLGQIVTMADQVDEVLVDDAHDAVAPELGRTVSAWRRGVVGAAVERRYYVYKRAGEPCRVCGSRVRTAVVAGRNLFWCGRCQRRR